MPIVPKGTPWHAGFPDKMKEEKKRHKSRCYYYNSNKNYCILNEARCIGSAHCDDYRENNNH